LEFFAFGVFLLPVAGSKVITATNFSNAADSTGAVLPGATAQAECIALVTQQIQV